MTKCINFVLFQICWFGCILGATNDLPYLGPFLAILTAITALMKSESYLTPLSFFLTVAVIGTAGDLIPLALGAFSFDVPTSLPWGYPIWMSSLWFAFATTVNSSLSWLQNRYSSASALGLIGGPLAYIAGEKLGAISLGSNIVFSLLVISCFWAAITPAIFYLSTRFRLSEIQ